MSIPIERWTLILKIDGKWSFSYETKASIHFSRWGEWIYGAQSKMKEDYYVNQCLSQLKDEL